MTVSPYNSVSFGSMPYAQEPVVKYGPYVTARVAGEYEEATTGESSLGSELLYGGLFMGGLQSAPKLIHPIKTYHAIKDANTAYSSLTSDSFQKLTNLQKGEAYSTLFNKARLEGKVSNPILKDAIAKTTKDYTVALKSGDVAKASAHKAELDTLIKLGKSKKSATEVINAATEAGKSAAKATKTAVTAAKAGATTAKSIGTTAKAAGTWTKNALKTGGGVVMVGIEGAIEVGTEVAPAFSESKSEGMKQLGKSAVNVAGSVGGWCVGAKAGAAGGAAIGTAICPGIGSAIGGVIGGIIGGISGSWAGRKVAKAATGKSYSEKKAEEAQKAQQQTTQNQTPVADNSTEYNPFAQNSFNHYNPFATNNVDTFNPYQTANYDQFIPKFQSSLY